jgi:hypothetical protein
MTDFAFMAKIHLQRIGETPCQVNLRLSDTPVGPLKVHFPVDAARHLLFDARRRESMRIVSPDR